MYQIKYDVSEKTRWMPTNNAVIWWCNASWAATRRGGAPLRRYKSEEMVSKTREKGIANTLTDISVRYARWECVTRFSQHKQIIHDRFYRNFQAPVAVKKTICHWIIVHSFLLMRIYLRKSNQNFAQDVISEALFSIYEFVFPWNEQKWYSIKDKWCSRM